MSTTLHPPHVQAVINAWSLSGHNPALHQQAQQYLQKIWPAPANALRHLAAV